MSVNETLQLQNRITKLAMIGILLTGLVVGLAAAIPFYLQLRNDSEEAMRLHVHAQSQSVGQLFSKFRDVAQQLTSRTQIRRRLEQYNRGEVTLENLNEFSVSRLQDAIGQSGEIAGLTRLDVWGNAVIQVGQNAGNPHWPSLPDDVTEPVFGRPQMLGHTPGIVIAAPIINRHGEHVGTDIVTFKSTTLQALLNDNETLGVDAHQYLTNLSHHLVITPTGQGKPLSLLPKSETPVADHTAAHGQAVLLQQEGQPDRVLFNEPVPGMVDWALIVTTTADAIYRPVLMQIIPPVISIVLMVLAGVILTARIIRPLATRVVTTSHNLSELSAQQQSLLELAQGFSFQQNREGVFTYASPGVREVLGIAPGELPLHQSALLTANPVNASLTRQQDLILSQRHEVPPFVIEMHHRNGDDVMLEVYARPLESNGEVIGISGVARDVTQRIETEEQLRLAASVFEGSHEGIMIMDTDNRIIDVNQAFSDITGYSAKEVSGLRLREFLTSERFDERTCEVIWHLVDDTGSWQGEVWYRRKDGEIFPAWQNMSALRNEQGESVRYIGVFTDISEKKASEERIHHLAHYDLLTDLPNRVLLADRLQNALDRMRRAHSRLGLLFLDLDRFKNINDSLGHPIGDLLLQEVAQRLKQAIREQDIVARLGGDEFLLVIESLSEPEYAGNVARKIHDALNQKVQIGQHELFVGASIGISIFPDDGRDPETLIKNADTAMYRAKDTGRNNYQFYTPELTRLSMERFEIERDLRLALKRNELLLHYQPQIALSPRRCVGAEALVRWAHPEKGLIPPDKFIPLAEEAGLILELGRWVLEQACRQAVQWKEQGMPLRIAVNLSGQQIIYGDLVAVLREVMQQTGIEPALLELEITEGFVLNHAEEGVQNLEQLHELGIGIAIDDFGTGYSSLSYLKRLPIDRLKIDKSFVHGVPDDGDDAAIISTIVAMANSLRLEVIAEGVESEAQLRFLDAQGCHEVQGYLLSRPIPAEEFVAWYTHFFSQGQPAEQH